MLGIIKHTIDAETEECKSNNNVNTPLDAPTESTRDKNTRLSDKYLNLPFVLPYAP